MQSSRGYTNGSVLEKTPQFYDLGRSNTVATPSFFSTPNAVTDEKGLCNPLSGSFWTDQP